MHKIDVHFTLKKKEFTVSLATTSRLQNFYKLTQEQRLALLEQTLSNDNLDIKHFQDMSGLDFKLVDAMIENAIGTMNIPIGIATNMIIDGVERLIPMATEESSVVAAVCNAAKQCRDTQGFYTYASGSVMIGQIQLLGATNPYYARQKILERQQEIKEICNSVDPMLVSLGGGFLSVEVRILDDGIEPIIVVHILVDTLDAMGANAVNSMAESLSQQLELWIGAKANMRILSNLADQRIVMARAKWSLKELGGEQVRDAMLAAYRFADCDPYRAATHNKGIMNGVSAVVLATGNDTRAVEAGAHAYACRFGQYRSLSSWEIDKDGNLCGTLQMPLAVGLIGGATKIHPTAQQNLSILGVKTAQELARVICAVGLAQNYAAMKALVTTGIQQGHMSLHAKNMAIMAGATGSEVELVATKLTDGGRVRLDLAQKFLQDIRDEG